MTNQAGNRPDYVIISAKPRRYTRYEDVRAEALARPTPCAHVAILNAPDHCVICGESRHGRHWVTGRAVVIGTDGTWSVQDTDVYDERKWLWLWFFSQLDAPGIPGSGPVPLGVIREDGTLVWADGQMPLTTEDPVLQELILALPMVTRVVPIDELKLTFSVRSNVQQGPPFKWGQP